MTDLAIALQLDEHDGPYWPGEIISGRYGVRTAADDDVRAVELSILWYTVGQGEEDLAVHHFERRAADSDDEGHQANFSSLRHFQSKLPNSPLSYEGILVKIRWCVRVRVFRARGKEALSDKRFFLGAVPRAQAVTPSP
ncbi:MAG: hypothetical protein A2W31_01855 [Planctomycetes bacterium RBG_16_64_10]|nr:MAG: hypothetical protein A2W31_01855 [Planctomycetes bacterium RBG_16_64_10]